MLLPGNSSGERMYAGLSLLKVSAKFKSNGNGSDTVHICQQSACMHTQKCSKKFAEIISEKLHSKLK